MDKFKSGNLALADEEKPDVLALMSDIRRRVEQELAHSSSDSRPALKLYQSNSEANVQRRAGELLHSEELRHLNQNHAYAMGPDYKRIVTHRKGWIGRLIVKAKRRFLKVIWDTVLREYFAAEKDFQTNLVRFLNDASKYIDARDASNFWELVRKIDVDVTRAVERIERINDEQMASIRSAEMRMQQSLNALASVEVMQTKEELERFKAKVKVLDNVVSGLEGIIAKLGTNSAEGQNLPHPERIDYSYLMLENRFRGSEDEISSRLNLYTQVFEKSDLPILEIGAGRGELQKLFKSAQITSYAVDLDRAMVQHCLSQGLNVLEANGLTHLEELADSSLGGLIAIQVVEHLSREQLGKLCNLAAKKVNSKGRIVFETINPCSVQALSSNYFRDPTHIWPWHPDTLAYMVTLSGLRVIEVKYLSPVNPEAKLSLLKNDIFMSPRWNEFIEHYNRNVTRLNDLLFSCQDYCVIAEKA